MPLYREWSSDPYSLAAIWELKEPEGFFVERTGINSDIKSEKRRLEHLGGRFLLKYLKDNFPLLNIRPDEHDKPRLPDNQFYFSISHSFPFVAVVLSPYVECGIDIQVWHPRMEQLQHKFLAEKEQLFFQGDPRLITLGWCAKEAVYKWQGRRGVDFIEHLPIVEVGRESNIFNITFNLQFTVPKLEVATKGFIEAGFACSCVVHRHIFHPSF